MRTISQNDQETVVHKEQRKLPSQVRSFCLLGGAVAIRLLLLTTRPVETSSLNIQNVKYIRKLPLKLNENQNLYSAWLLPLKLQSSAGAWACCGSMLHLAH